MPQARSKPIAWRPRGVSDTLDASTAFQGAMASLQNLIPDPTTKNLFQCRPAAIELINFAAAGGPFSSGFSSGFQHSFALGPIGAISALKVIGNYAFGMVATGLNPGHDQPFCFNLLTDTFVPISGITAANTPVSPSQTGAWVPPTMALIGSKLIVTHPGFNGAGNGYVGILDITTIATPAWSSGNMGGALSFTIPPSAVYQFNGRAWYIHNLPAQPALFFSDSLNPLIATMSSQILTFGDNVILTALGGLMLQNQLGGIVQSLIVFKGVQNIYQITGDASSTSNPLTLNSLNITTGTLAPNTVINTPKGLMFVSPDGVRLINFQANVSDPIGIDGMGVTVPFINVITPSRMAAACGGNIARFSLQNGYVAGSPYQEYWYDIARGIWTGTHTLPMSLIAPYNDTFVGQPQSLPGTLFQSDVVQSSGSTYVENGAQLSWVSTTALLPDTDQMTNSAMTETTLDLAISAATAPINISAIDENGAVQNSVQIMATGTATQWGNFTWGNAPWGAALNNLAPRQLPWTVPIVFTKIQIQASGQSASVTKIGALHLRYQILRYLSSVQAA